jgi:ABC-2 type transport system permease protein
MRLPQIARKDVGDSIRGWRLHTLVVMFALVGGALAYFVDADFAEALVLLLAFLSPLVGLLFSQHSIVGKRDSGELTVLLGLPFSRLEVFLGTYLGRTVVLTIAVASAYATTAVVAVLLGKPIDANELLIGFVLITLLGMVFVALAIGFSAVTRSTSAASVYAFGMYLLFAFQLWRLLPDGVLFLLNDFEIPNNRPEWARIFEQLSPFAGTRNIAAGVAPDLADPFPVVAASVPPNPPVYMTLWFALGVVLVWLAVPLLGGYVLFNRNDL